MATGDLVGQEISYYVERKGKKVVIDGVCEGWRRAPGYIEDKDGNRWLGVEFLVKPKTGRRFWTIAYKDHDHPIPMRRRTE